MNRLSQRTQYGGSPEGGQGGGYAGYWKIALYKRFSFNLFFFFFSQHCCVVLDLRCRFYDLVLKEVVFFSGKTKKKSSHYECLFFFVAGKFESLLHTHVFSFEIYTAYKVFNPWIFHVLLLFNKDSIGPFHTHRDVRRHSNIYWKLTDCIFWGVL